MREEKFVTDGGISIYGYKNPALNSFHISLFVKAGCMYEKEGELGITHFFEHIAIRNVNAGMGGALYPTLDRFGLEFNASTYSEMVQFYITGASEHADVGARLISDVLRELVLRVQDRLGVCVDDLRRPAHPLQLIC